MLTSREVRQEASDIDKLLALLADAKKAEAYLKQLQSLQKQLLQIRKDILGARSVEEHKKEVEKEKQAIIKSSEERLLLIQGREEKAKKESLAALAKSKKQYDDAVKELQKVVDAKKELAEAEEAFEEFVEETEYLHQKAVDEIEAAEALKAEYSHKLENLKERLRGL